MSSPTKTSPLSSFMEIEEIKSEFSKFTDHSDKDFNDLLSELCEHYLEIQGAFSVMELKEHASNPRDWEDFDIYIKLLHQKIIPPLHYYDVQYSPDITELQEFNKLNI